MTNSNNGSLKNNQEDTVPQIQTEIHRFLDGNLKERALEFAAYLDLNQMTPRRWFGPGYWRVPYGENYLCCIVIDQDRWRFWFLKGDYNGNIDARYEQVIHDHVRPCIPCTTDCQFGKDIAVFGKAFENTCFQFPIQFENPDANTLHTVKALIAYWKDVAPRSDSWHVRDSHFN